MARWQRYRSAIDQHWKFQNHVIARGIFVSPDLAGKFREISDLNYDALEEFRFDQEMGENNWEGRFNKRDRFLEEWEPRQNGIRADVQARLWDAAKFMGADGSTTSG